MDKAAKENEAAITGKAETWGKLEKKRLAVEAKLAADCAPADAVHEKATRKFVEEASLALSSLVPELAALDLEIKADMLAGCNAETGVVQLPQVTAKLGKATVVVQVTSKAGPRLVSVGKFFALCLKLKRLGLFFGCSGISVTKAKEAVGDEVLNTISTKTTAHTVELKLSA